MKFTIVSHACMYVEHDGVSVLIDPWISRVLLLAELVELSRAHAGADRLAATRLHLPDAPALGSLPRTVAAAVSAATTKVLIPKTSRYSVQGRPRVAWLHRRHEIAHGATRLARAWIRAALVSVRSSRRLGDRDHRWQDSRCSTSMTRSSLARRSRRSGARFGSFDFVFKSHSSASPIPYCIEGYEGRFSEVAVAPGLYRGVRSLRLSCRRALRDSVREQSLLSASRHVRFNDTAVNPQDVAAHFNARADEQGRSRAVVMPPGSSWDDRLASTSERSTTQARRIHRRSSRSDIATRSRRSTQPRRPRVSTPLPSGRTSQTSSRRCPDALRAAWPTGSCFA